MIADNQIEKVAGWILLELQGQLDEEQRASLEAFRNGSEENAALVKRLLDKQLLANRLQAYEKLEFSKAANKAKLLARIHPPARRIGFRWQYTAAAAIATLLTAGTWIYLKEQSAPKHIQLSQQHDLPPGKSGATLTLSNGKQIRLGDAANGDIAEEAGISISKTANGQLIYTITQQAAGTNANNTLSTAKGETYKVLLPDGTTVWLNAASSLTYNAGMGSMPVRRVSLQGEAWFDVAQQAASPFVVASQGQEITVLGTSFNLNTYENESAVKTTLVNGKIKVTAGVQDVILRPGEESVLSGNNISVHPADVKAATAWKDGYFSFRKTDLGTIMRQFERWYNVEVEYRGRMPGRRITGNIPREATLAEALEIIAYFNVRTEISGGKIIVSDAGK